MRAVLTAMAAAVLIFAPAARAERGPCIPGDKSSPSCLWWDAKVTLVADGDTLKANIDGVGPRVVRVTGINAMELTTYSHTPSARRGACHGKEAAAFVDHYVNPVRGHVRLAAQKASSRSGPRLRRSLWVRSGGKLVDVAAAELAAGHALWLPNTDETAHNAEYGQLAAQAIKAGRNLYDPDACGKGPDEAAQIELAINWDANGGDEKNRNGEWVDIRNTGQRSLNLKNWWFRDSALRGAGKLRPGYVFGPGAVIPPGGSLRLRGGCGRDKHLELHWCAGETIFENVQDAKGAGDGGYLFDPDGDLRASALYPCQLDCRASLPDGIRLDVSPSTTPETVTVVNGGDGDFDMRDHVLKLRNHGLIGQYVFGILLPLGKILDPGDRWTWRAPAPNTLSNNGGVVELRTLDDRLVACRAWGFGKC